MKVSSNYGCTNIYSPSYRAVKYDWNDSSKPYPDEADLKLIFGKKAKRLCKNCFRVY